MKELLTGIDYRIITSDFLGRPVRVDVYFPVFTGRGKCDLLILNDGQDAEALKLDFTLNNLFKTKDISNLIIAAVHANENRMQEYGIASQVDYLGRGNRAFAYSDFVVRELIPYLKLNYPVAKRKYAIAGFSLGGLSAFDIAWNHVLNFDRSGVFSGSFWWRSKAYENGYTEADRIAHAMVRNTYRPGKLKVWLQCGTQDETHDRNNNNIIDSIDDTLDLMFELSQVGYTAHDVEYRQVRKGKHDFTTWSKVFPEFLIWAFGK